MEYTRPENTWQNTARQPSRWETGCSLNEGTSAAEKTDADHDYEQHSLAQAQARTAHHAAQAQERVHAAGLSRAGPVFLPRAGKSCTARAFWPFRAVLSELVAVGTANATGSTRVQTLCSANTVRECARVRLRVCAGTATSVRGYGYEVIRGNGTHYDTIYI